MFNVTLQPVFSNVHRLCTKLVNSVNSLNRTTTPKVVRDDFYLPPLWRILSLYNRCKKLGSGVIKAQFVIYRDVGFLCWTSFVKDILRSLRMFRFNNCGRVYLLPRWSRFVVIRSNKTLDCTIV